MIAAQYTFVLPSDYDMSIIDRRVSEKGHVLDNHAPLLFKAYLSASKNDSALCIDENLYAPFYLWHDTAGLQNFVCSEGFRGLADSFGWPSVSTWPLVIGVEIAGECIAASFASKEIISVQPFTGLDRLRELEQHRMYAERKDPNLLLTLTALEPTNWRLVRFKLWRQNQDCSDAGVSNYKVLHVSYPGSGRSTL